MPMSRIKLVSAAALLSAVVAAAALPAAAQTDAASYPNRTVHIIVPASPGGVNDILARLVAVKMNEIFGQSIVVENRPGAATITGTELVARSLPDGYTLLMAPMATMAINPAIYSKLSYTPQDFRPISIVASYPYVLAVTNATPVRTVGELVAYAKANPAKANSGGGSATFQLLTNLFGRQTGTSFEYIPYKGANDAALALIAGELLAAFVDFGPAAPNIEGGQFRALAVTSPSRMSSFPDVPTMAEAGLKDMTVTSWAGLFAPTGTPPDVVSKLQDAVVRTVGLTDFRERLRALELDPVGSTSEESARIVAQDLERWSAAARAAKLRIN